MTWLIAIWRWIATSRAGRAVGAAIAIFAALWLARAKWRSDGRTEAEKDMQDADRQRADDIRRRARDAEWVQPDDDDRGWRD